MRRREGKTAIGWGLVRSLSDRAHFPVHFRRHTAMPPHQSIPLRYCTPALAYSSSLVKTRPSDGRHPWGGRLLRWRTIPGGPDPGLLLGRVFRPGQKAAIRRPGRYWFGLALCQGSPCCSEQKAWVSEGFSKGFRRGQPRTLLKPFQNPSKSFRDPPETPSETLQKPF